MNIFSRIKSIFQRISDIQERFGNDHNQKQIENFNGFAKILGQTINKKNDKKVDIDKSIDKIVDANSKKYNIDKDLINAVIKNESDFNINAVSSKGALGLMQLMPSTAEELGVENPLMPENNVNGGAKYLQQLLDIYNGDINKALAAYNAGPGNVKKYEGIPPFNETKKYVENVVKDWKSSL